MSKTDVTPGTTPFDRHGVKDACPPPSLSRGGPGTVEQPYLDRLPEKKKAHFSPDRKLLGWLGRFDQSIEAGEAALRVDPLPDLGPFLYLGLAYYEQRRHAEALSVLERGVARRPDDPFMHAALAATYAQLDRMPEAARERTIVRRVNPFFDAKTFGASFQNPAHHAYLAEGLAKAGLN